MILSSSTFLKAGILLPVFVALFLYSSSIASVFAQETPYFGASASSSADLPFSAKFPQIKEQVVSEVDPEIPKPGDEVTITTELYGDIDLNTTLVTWRVNGEVQLKGVGKKKFVFTMGNTGKLTTVEFEASPTNAPLITKTFNFAPIDVDILWQANTYTPPFYKGKALFTPEANVTFIAVPNIIMGGKRVDPSDIVYNWKVNRTVDGENSGFGKNSYDYTGSIILKPTLIQAEVYAAANNAFKGLNGFTISHVFPQALVYEDNPTYGILFNKALRNQYTIKADEVQVSLVPYFFSTEGKNESVTYKWNLNNNPLAIPDFQNSAIFRRKDDKKGSANINVTIGNPSKILQKAVANLGIVFNEKRSTFGQ